jgi:aconitate hydratase
VHRAVTDAKLVASAVLSGNRNFEGRINPDVKANYLASPPLVVAYALAGSTAVDLARDPIGKDRAGKPVYLSDIWPSQQEVDELERRITEKMFASTYADVFNGNPMWNGVKVPAGDLYAFRDDSTYIQEPPFFQGLTLDVRPPQDIKDARILALLGDSVTTDHISPAGDIAENSPAGQYLKSRGVARKDFNSYGSRRGNDRVMVRGTFANIRLKNLMVPGVEGGVTVHVPSGEVMPIYDAAERYRRESVPLMVVAGKEYGSGSSRDWAAKGTLLLGVRAVLAESFERIHRSNLVGMGVLPLQFKPGEGAETFRITGKETLSIVGVSGPWTPRQDVTVDMVRADGSRTAFVVTARLDSPVEINYYRNGGILHTVLRKMLKG